MLRQAIQQPASRRPSSLNERIQALHKCLPTGGIIEQTAMVCQEGWVGPALFNQTLCLCFLQHSFLAPPMAGSVRSIDAWTSDRTIMARTPKKPLPKQ
jgi:hypothetical protein